jgi:hypothetical protein
MLVRTPQQLLQHPFDRLRILAVEIRRAHAQAEQATRRSIEAMISAGESCSRPNPCSILGNADPG